MVSIIRLRQNDRIQLKKNHPCGGNTFRILRVGSDVRIVCETCGHDMTVERVRLEKSIRQVFPAEPMTIDPEKKGTGTPT